MRRISLLVILSLALVLMLPGAVSANSFTISSDEAVLSTCATDTALYVIPVTNTGGTYDSYTASVSGSAAKWSVAAPSGFRLMPGETEYVYVYTTPSVDALTGTYDLEVTIAGSLGGSKEIPLNVVVLNCHSAILTAVDPIQLTCSCTTAEVFLNLQNTGKYTENYRLFYTGSAEDWATVSDDIVRLEPGESTSMTAYITPPCDVTGEFDLTVAAYSEDSGAVTSTDLRITSLPCYDFELLPEKNYYSLCEAEELIIPVTINNEGTADNTYELSVDGPRWATLEKSEIFVPSGTSITTNLILFPEYKVFGDYKITVSANGALGEVSMRDEVTANVRLCHATDLKAERDSDTVCPYTQKAYEFSLANIGEYAENYAIVVNGIDWADIENNFIQIGPSGISSFNVVINPKDVVSGVYSLKVEAESQEPCHTSAEDEILITIPSMDNCYGVKATAALTGVEVAYGEGALVPIIVENKGLETATYNLEVSGNGASYAQLNPGTVTLEGSESRTVYLYISAPEETVQNKYNVIVSARLEDGTVSSSTSVDIFVKEGGRTRVPFPERGVESTQERIDRFFNFFKGLFTGASWGEIELPEVRSPSGARIEMLFDGNELNQTEKFGSTYQNLAEFKSGLRTRIDTTGESITSIYKDMTAPIREPVGGAISSVRKGLTAETYGACNWLWILTAMVLIVVVALGISNYRYMRREAPTPLPEDKPKKRGRPPKTPPLVEEEKPEEKNNFWGRFKDFLEEEEEKK